MATTPADNCRSKRTTDQAETIGVPSAEGVPISSYQGWDAERGVFVQDDTRLRPDFRLFRGASTEEADKTSPASSPPVPDGGAGEIPGAQGLPLSAYPGYNHELGGILHGDPQLRPKFRAPNHSPEEESAPPPAPSPAGG